jgi:GT2 family glycosyltransferase
MDIAILMTCHNRRDKTLACLDSLAKQRLMPTITLKVILMDDGSYDGTSAAVKKQFPEVDIFEGNGTLYWNGGMGTAFSIARVRGFDAYLLLNDDTILVDDAVSRLIEVYQAADKPAAGRVIVVGSTKCPNGNDITYGGLQKGPRWKPLRFTRVRPQEAHPVACDTFNCNCVLIPQGVVEVVGNLDEAFTHGMGDIDYGLRAARLGCELLVAPGFVGECELNRGKGLWTNPSLSLLERWSRFIGPKGLPPMEWLIFTRRHSGLFWPLYWLNPYLSFWSSALRKQLTRHKEVGQP